MERLATGLILNLLAAGIAAAWVWSFAAILNPDIDSGMVWLLVALLGFYVNREMFVQAKQDGLL